MNFKVNKVGVPSQAATFQVDFNQDFNLEEMVKTVGKVAGVAQVWKGSRYCLIFETGTLFNPKTVQKAVCACIEEYVAVLGLALPVSED